MVWPGYDSRATLNHLVLCAPPGHTLTNLARKQPIVDPLQKSFDNRNRQRLAQFVCAFSEDVISRCPALVRSCAALPNIWYPIYRIVGIVAPRLAL